MRGPRAAPAPRLPGPVEPDVEEVAQVAVAVGLGEVDELLGPSVAVGVVSRPVPEDAEEGRLAHLLAQRLERHAATGIDRRVEEVLRAPGIAGWRIPERVVAGAVPPVEAVEDLLGRLPAPALAPPPPPPRPGPPPLT